jgi:hypothetical protein
VEGKRGQARLRDFLAIDVKAVSDDWQEFAVSSPLDEVLIGQSQYTRPSLWSSPSTRA